MNSNRQWLLAKRPHGMVSRDIEPLGVTPRNPDFLAIARGFGAAARSPDSLDALSRSIVEAFDTPGPTLIEVREDAPYLTTIGRSSVRPLQYRRAGSAA